MTIYNKATKGTSKQLTETTTSNQKQRNTALFTYILSN